MGQALDQRQPTICIDSMPPTEIRKFLCDEQRATSLVYEHLVTTAGLGVAELWIEALAWGRSHHPYFGLAQGWYLYASPESEAIARVRHPRAPQHVLSFSHRAWERAKRDYYSSDYYSAITR